jgi:putative toxin-antitoxin system antitoxin component (TIGR02293 family)
MKANLQEGSSEALEGVSEAAGIFQDTLLMNHFSEEGIPYALFQQIQEVGPLTLEDWADILGISSKTLTRYRKENKIFQVWHSAVILEMTELLSMGMEVFGDREKLHHWLLKDSFALGGRSPISLLTNGYGRDLVMRELTLIEYGIFA